MDHSDSDFCCGLYLYMITGDKDTETKANEAQVQGQQRKSVGSQGSLHGGMGHGTGEREVESKRIQS